MLLYIHQERGPNRRDATLARGKRAGNRGRSSDTQMLSGVSCRRLVIGFASSDACRLMSLLLLRSADGLSGLSALFFASVTRRAQADRQHRRRRTSAISIAERPTDKRKGRSRRAAIG